MRALPAWADVVLLPVLNLALALLVTAALVLATGNDPVLALRALALGSLGNASAIGYTLYYATDLVFTGLAVAVAFQAGLFNIGAEGQVILGGLGVTAVALAGGALPGIVVVPLAILAGAASGAVWGAIPGWLQARRGSHIVITTIMFNFLASLLMVWLVVNVLTPVGITTPESRGFQASAALPLLGFAARAPLNLALVLALVAAAGVWLLLWRTPFGYAVRVLGGSARVALYAGIPAARMTVLVMALAGALASGVAINELLGAQHRLLLGFSGGYGFTGIAVSLMGRNHPAGVVLAALLFGALTQGGAELAFEMPAVPSEVVVLIQGLVVLFAGALGNLLRPGLVRVLGRR